MSREEFRNEKLYQTTMHLARKMLSEGIISEEEYRQIDTMIILMLESHCFKVSEPPILYILMLESHHNM